MSKLFKLFIAGVRWLFTTTLQFCSKVKKSSVFRLGARIIAWPFVTINRLVHNFEPWGIFLALIAFFFTMTGFMLELEDRQSERIFRAWEFVLRVTTTPSKINPNVQVAAQGSSVREAMEYMNRKFDGMGCFEWVGWLSNELNGNIARECIFPKKERESFEFFSIPGASLFKIKLPGADLRGADLSRAKLWEADLRGADLSGVALEEAALRKAKLWGADLREADLSRADLRGATGINCDQLKRARIWEKAYRDKSLACGTPIPTPPSRSRRGR